MPSIAALSWSSLSIITLREVGCKYVLHMYTLHNPLTMALLFPLGFCNIICSLPRSAYTTLCRINSLVFAYIHCVHELFVGRTASRAVASGTKRLTHDVMMHHSYLSLAEGERAGASFCEVEGGGGVKDPLPKRVGNAVKHRELAPARPA
jgi:hypothetical protein